MRGAIPPLPNTSPSCGALLSTGTTLPLPLSLRVVYLKAQSNFETTFWVRILIQHAYVTQNMLWGGRVHLSVRHLISVSLSFCRLRSVICEQSTAESEMCLFA
jgi:hypothetical protein